ncbi:MAG: hypothetical protein R2855_09900 [Thermomicrobiales bacterium]
MLELTTPESLRETAEIIGMNETWLQSDPTPVIWPPQTASDATQADVDAARAYIEAAAQLGPVNIASIRHGDVYAEALDQYTDLPFVYRAHWASWKSN